MELVSTYRGDQEMPSSALSSAGLGTHSEVPKTTTPQSHGHEAEPSLNCEKKHGIISRLYSACLESLRQIVRDTNPAFVRKRDLNILRRVLSTLRLWGDGYGAGTGLLDTKLQRSEHLYSATLSLLRSLCRSIQQGLTEVILFHLETLEAVALRTTCVALTEETKILLTNARRKSSLGSSGGTNLDQSNRSTNRDDQHCSDSDVEEDSDSDSDDDEDLGLSRAEDCVESPWFTAFVSEALLCTTCLTDLGTALDCPATSPGRSDDIESIALWADQVPSGASATEDKIKSESQTATIEGELQSSSLPVNDAVVPAPICIVPIGVPASQEEQDILASWPEHNLEDLDLLAPQEEQRSFTSWLQLNSSLVDPVAPQDGQGILTSWPDFKLLPFDAFAPQEDQRDPSPQRLIFDDGKLGDDSIPKKEPRAVVPPTPTQDVSVKIPNDGLQPKVPASLLDYSYEETFALLDNNGPFIVLDLKDVDNTWATRSRPSSPWETPDLCSTDTTPSTRQSDISGDDNHIINIEVDIPDAWMMPLNGGALPLDVQEELQSLGVSLPPMDSDDMMLFPSLLDFEALEKQMEGSLAGSEAGIY